MLCYIKDFKDFKTIEKYGPLDYTISDGGSAHVLIKANPPQDYAGCWLIASDTHCKKQSNGHNYEIYYIESSTPSKNTLDLTIKSPIYAFNRPIYYPMGTAIDINNDTYGDFIDRVLTENFSSDLEPDFGLPYLKVIKNGDYTPCKITSDKFGYIVPSEVFETAMDEGVDIDFSIAYDNDDGHKINDKLLVTINPPSQNTEQIVFGDGHSIVAYEKYSPDYCSKVTILKELNTPTNVITRTDDTYSSIVDASFCIEFCYDPKKSFIKTSNGVRSYNLKARLVISWEVDSEKIEYFDQTKFTIYIKLNDGTAGRYLLRDKVFEWTRSGPNGEYVTDWFDLNNYFSWNIPASQNGMLPLHAIVRLYGTYKVGETVMTPGDITGDKYAEQVDVFVHDIINPDHIYEGEFQDGENLLFQKEDYYIDSDGVISQSKPSSDKSINGVWNILEIGPNDNIASHVARTFLNNNDNHRIEFYSDNFFKRKQKLKVLVNGKSYYTVINSRSYSKNDTRYYYTCGNLVSTVVDRIDKIEKKK